MNLSVLKKEYSIYKLNPSEKTPDIVLNSDFYSVSKTSEELSIVCESNFNISSREVECGWRVLKVEGNLDFSLTGILSSLALPLANKKISIFAISTFNTDYLMVKDNKLEEAISCLIKSGFSILR